MPGGFNALWGGHNAPELLHLTGGRRPGPASGGPRRIYPLVEKPVDPVDTAGTACKSAVHPHLAKLPPPAAAALLGRQRAELLERSEQRVAEQAGGLVRTLLGAPGGLRHDRVDHP